MSRSLDLAPLFERLDGARTLEVRGRVSEVTGLVVRARMPGVRIGELCYLVPRHHGRELPAVRAEVVGFEDRDVFLMTLGEVEGIGPDTEVRASGEVLRVPVGPGLLGRVLDGLGTPIDGLGALAGADGSGVSSRYPVYAPPPDPMTRKRILEPFRTHIRAFDGFLTVGQGQRVGIFAAAGGGKSTLLGMLARNTEADINVISLVGERGREVRDFIEESLGAEGLARSVVIVATSDQPSMVRLKSAYVATAVAEYFRDQGKKVLLMMDSVTRFARAQREVGLAIGEPPARSGFPPSVFATLPRLLERTGNSDRGSITAFYTVLVEGDDMSEPVADEVKSILDGHVVLSHRLAGRGHYPAIDVLASASRVFGSVADEAHVEAARVIRELLAAYEQSRDLILLGAYQAGSDSRVDRALEQLGDIEGFLRQSLVERPSFVEAISSLCQLAGVRAPGETASEAAS